MKPRVNGLLKGDRRILAKTITLIESSLACHQEEAQAILERLLPHTGKAIRLGITGVPGVGKSSFIECLGMLLIEKGLRVAVLAVDPSSNRSGGSILADKTRMERLSADESGVYPALSFRRDPGRGRPENPGNDAGLRGGRVST